MLKDAQQICSPTTKTNAFAIKEPKPCRLRVLDSVKTCSSQIYEIRKAVIPLKAYTCRLSVLRQTSYTSFWGVQTESPIQSALEPTSLRECMDIENTKISTHAGPLDKRADKLYESNNKIHLTHRWLTKLHSLTYNARLEYFDLYYNFLTQTIYLSML